MDKKLAQILSLSLLSGMVLALGTYTMWPSSSQSIAAAAGSGGTSVRFVDDNCTSYSLNGSSAAGYALNCSSNYSVGSSGSQSGGITAGTGGPVSSGGLVQTITQTIMQNIANHQQQQQQIQQQAQQQQQYVQQYQNSQNYGQTQTSAGGIIVPPGVPFAGTYTSTSALQTAITQSRFQNCVMYTGTKIYDGFGPCYVVPVNATAGAQTQTGTAQAGSIVVPPGVPFAGSYSSVAALQSAIQDSKFQNCVTYNGTSIYNGFGPCYSIPSTSTSSANTGSDIIVVPAGVPFSGSYGSMTALQSAIQRTSFQSCVTYRGVMVTTGFGPCYAIPN